MIPETKIAYAYNGFIYLPLFLAKYLGFLPQYVKLEYVSGDKETIEKLILNADEGYSFGICDPLMVNNYQHLLGRKETGKVDYPIIVGSLIKKNPMWLFNTNKKVLPKLELNELRGQITKIRSYEKPNTGYFVALRLLEILGIPEDTEHLSEVPFNHEFDQPIEFNEGVLTSNILKMAEMGFNSNNTIFSFPSKPSDYKELFFTGIVTRQTIFEENLPLVLSILSAIEKSINYLYNSPIDKVSETCYNAIFNIHPETLLYRDSSRDIPLIKGALEKTIICEDIYSHDLEIDRTAWDKSIELRKVIRGYSPPPFDVFTVNKPIILIKKDWNQRVDIVLKKADKIGTPILNNISGFDLLPIIRFIGIFITLLILLYLVLTGYKKFDNVNQFQCIIGIIVTSFVFVFGVVRFIIVLIKFPNYGTNISRILEIIGAYASAASLISLL